MYFVNETIMIHTKQSAAQQETSLRTQQKL